MQDARKIEYISFDITSEKAFCCGDEFEKITLAYREKLLRLARACLDSPEDAEEVVQDALLKVYRALPSFRGEAHIYTWLYRIVLNQVRTHHRRHRKKINCCSLENMLLHELFPANNMFAPDSEQPSYALECQELQLILQSIIDRLPRSMQQTVRLRYLENYSYLQISAILQCSPGTIKSRLSRARTLLKNIILQHSDLFDC